MNTSLKYNNKNIRLIVGLVLLALATLPVILTVFVKFYDPNEVNYSEMLQAPSFRHLFGTDDYGRDIFTRVMKGAATTFGISLFTVTMGAVIGTVIGALTGYFGGIVDEILMRVNDCLASFPSILLALVVVSLIDKGTWNICIALGLVFIPSFARIMRSEYLKEKNRDYVQNARLMGAGHLRVIFIHILPNTLPILFSAILVGINNAVLAEAGLSYLGLGVQPPDPSLGRMLSEAKTFLLNAPWYELFPCLEMILFILGLTLVSDNFGVSGVSLSTVKRKIEKLKAEKEGKSPVVEKTEDTPIISVHNLEVGFIEDEGIDDTLRGISFDIRKGEVLGVVGESGSGKSLTAMSIMGILSDKAAITGGSIILEGNTDLTKLPEEEYRKLRGGKLAYVFQEPVTSLNPVQKIGVQIDEILDIHAAHLSEEEQKKLVLDALEDTGLKDAEKLYDMYPFELSGGMRQRVCIAMALIAKADLILADEPTTALDAGVADIILDIFKHINRKYKTAIMLISHDLRVIGKLADRVLIMQDGNIVETMDLKLSGANTESDSSAEKHHKKGAELSEEECILRFGTPKTDYGRKLLDAAFSKKQYKQKVTGKTLVKAEHLSVSYKMASRKQKGLKKVIDDVSFEIKEGSTVGIVGESGSGKSTLVKAIAGLQKYTSGKIELGCPRPSMVFQDPYSSLNPAFKVRRILEEPLRLKNGFGYAFKKKNRDRMLTEIKSMLHKTELEEEILTRKISELSGGQRQRIAIALTLIQKKSLIILDEPVSALDVTIQEQILELLMKLKKAFGLTYILISHDMRLVSRVCDEVYTIEEGKLCKG
ncbi:MAG: ATP-binding cassette domain-containing protein [Lachnospiraceae bacterium]|nr:ATP-binding cassette domain-containing protein [Lachnospiraceae bacterium]